MFGIRSISARKSSAGGQQLYDTPGLYSWTAPAGVTSVSVVCVGAGRSGGGGLGWKNNIPVVPGQSYTVRVGSATSTNSGEQDSWFISSSTVFGGGAEIFGLNGGTFLGDGGGNGGGRQGGSSGAGGAGGYLGNGGNGVQGGSGGFAQDGSGGKTFAWPGSVRWAGGTAPTITSAARMFGVRSVSARKAPVVLDAIFTSSGTWVGLSELYFD